MHQIGAFKYEIFKIFFCANPPRGVVSFLPFSTLPPFLCLPERPGGGGSSLESCAAKDEEGCTGMGAVVDQGADNVAAG